MWGGAEGEKEREGGKERAREQEIYSDSKFGTQESAILIR